MKAIAAAASAIYALVWLASIVERLIGTPADAGLAAFPIALALLVGAIMVGWVVWVAIGDLIAFLRKTGR